MKPVTDGKEPNNLVSQMKRVVEKGYRSKSGHEPASPVSWLSAGN